MWLKGENPVWNFPVSTVCIIHFDNTRKLPSHSIISKSNTRENRCATSTDTSSPATCNCQHYSRVHAVHAHPQDEHNVYTRKHSSAWAIRQACMHASHLPTPLHLAAAVAHGYSPANQRRCCCPEFFTYLSSQQRDRERERDARLSG